MAFAQQTPDQSQTAYITGDLRFSQQAVEGPWAILITHPDQNTHPTADDLAQASDHDLLLILSLNTKGVLEIQAWQGQNAERKPVELKI